MRQAITKALQGVGSGQTPFGACIVKDGRTIALAHNVVWATTDITAHAEVNAIRQACQALDTVDLSGCVLYSTCEPCPMCFSAIHWAGISRIFYGNTISDAQGLGFGELTISNAEMKRLGGSKVEITPEFLKEECQQVFNIWLSRRDRKVY